MRPSKPFLSFVFWLGVFAMSLLVMVQPAQASGTVAKTSYSYINSYPTPHFDTPALACAWVLSAYPGYPAAASVAVVGQTSSAFTCQYYNASGGGAGGYSGTIVGNVCPTNSTGTTTCTCTDPYIPNAGATACVMPVCPAAGTVKSSGFYDVGVDPNVNQGAPPLQTCDASCPSAYNGSNIGYRSLVGGVYHYFAAGSYVSSGTANCSGGVPSPSVVTSIPASTCASGQSFITMGGVTKCLNSSGQVVDGNSASAVAAAKTLADLAAVSAIAAAGTLAQQSGLSASGVEAARADAAGAAGFAGAGTTPLANLPANDPLQSFCKTNPTADICKAQTVQAGTGAALPSIGTGSWYVKTYPSGVGGVLTANFNNMKTTPLAGLITNLVPTLSGAAHNGCFTLSVWKMGNQTLCIPSIVMSALGVFMILTALFAARSIVFGG